MARNTYVDDKLDEATDTGGEAARRRKLDVLAPRKSPPRPQRAAPPRSRADRPMSAAEIALRRRQVTDSMTFTNSSQAARHYSPDILDQRRRDGMRKLNALPNRGLPKKR